MKKTDIARLFPWEPKVVLRQEKKGARQRSVPNGMDEKARRKEDRNAEAR